MDTKHTDRITDRFIHLRLLLEETTGQARRAIEATRRMQESETMQHVLAQQRLRHSDEAVRKSVKLMR